jgi:hypothetical protein
MDQLGKLRPLRLLRVQFLRVVRAVQKPETLVQVPVVESGLLTGKEQT